jgi:CoA-transferase family III
MPRGTAALALALAERAAGAAAAVTGTVYRVDRRAVLGHLLLPLVVGDAADPAAPRPAPGGGAVHADVLADDEDLLGLLAGGPPPPDAEELARRAQECRLPVTPYRRLCATARQLDAGAQTTRALEPGAVTVVDMTAMWAGPLCTRLLADWGARVVTIEPAVRRDGLRRSAKQFAVLDRGKQRVAWDLRERADRASFETAVGAANVLVESFSRRVLPNLGYSAEALRRLNPRLTVVAIRAFPPGSAEASWVAYGRGVHAASGLGVVDGTPTPSLLAYPDPLAAIAAFGTVLGALGGPGGTVEEVTLAGAIAPLLATAGQPLGDVDVDAIGSLPVPGPILVPG